MEYKVRSFSGVCPKTGENRIVNVLYQPTENMKMGECLQKFTFRCECPTCPIFKDAPEYLPPNC